MGDADDRARLMELGEFDREVILAQRAEEREALQETNRIRRAKNEKRAARRAAKEKATRRATRTRAPAAGKVGDKGKSALDSLVAQKRAKEQRKREIEDELHGRKGLRARKEDDEAAAQAAAYEAMEEYAARDSDGDEDYAAGAASDEEGGVRDPGARRRRRREEEDEESPPAQLQDIKSILLRRQQLAKWHNQPFFEDAVVGAFVRVSLGNNSEGQLVYRLARIREVRDRSAEVGKSYAFGGRDNRSHETTKYLLLEQGASERVFPMRECSNAVDEIPEDEERWLFKLLEQSDSVPTRRDCEAVARQLQQANDFRYGSQHVKLMVEERRQKGLVHEGTTREKVRLNVERQAAIKAGDAERVAELAAKIEALERRVEQERLSDQRAQRVSMASINERNKKWTVAQDQVGGKARREAGGGDGAQDNFSRYKTRPQKYFQMRKATGAGEGGGEGGAQGGGEGGAQGASADAGEDKDDQEAMEETADLLASHVPNLHVDLGRVQAAARRLLGGGGGVGAGSGGGGLPWLGHTLKHLPPQSNLVEPPDKVYQITLEEYHRRVEG